MSSLVTSGKDSAVAMWMAGQKANQYRQMRDQYQQAARQAMIDAEAAAQRREISGGAELSKTRSLLAKGGLDASSGSALAVTAEQAGNIEWEAQMTRHAGKVAYWENWMKSREAGAASKVARRGDRDSAVASQAITTAAAIASVVLGIFGGIGAAAAGAGAAGIAAGAAQGATALSGGGSGLSANIESSYNWLSGKKPWGKA